MEASGICVEPWTGPPNSLNGPERKVLGPGEPRVVEHPVVAVRVDGQLDRGDDAVDLAAPGLIIRGMSRRPGRRCAHR
jgi:hypothetical protein